MKQETLLGRFLKWRIRKVSNRLFLLILSVVVGIGSGVAALILKSFTHYIQHFVVKGFDNPYDNSLFFAFPLLGILLTVIFFKNLIKEKAGHGVSSILFAISRKGGILKRTKMYSSMMGSAVTVGLGGSAGLEAPIVSTGAAIGSNLGRLMRLNYKSILLLIGSGAAGAIAAIFNAPIAGVVFALEVLMLDLTLASLIPILMASVTGTIMAKLLIGEEIMFSFVLRDQFTASDIPFYVFLGLFCGLVSVYFTKVEMGVESWIKRIKNEYIRAIWGGIALGVLIFVIPPLYGEGYINIKSLLAGTSEMLLNNSFIEGNTGTLELLFFLVLIMLIKPVATALTLGSGGVGGIFAPSLFLGGVTGYFFSKAVNYIGLPWQLSESNFVLVGMSGIMAGVLHAPLTALFLIAELTGGYQLIVPLMLVSGLSMITAKYFEPHSIYTKRLALRGQLITHHKDKAVLTLMKIGEVIESDFEAIRSGFTLGQLVKVVAKSKRNIFPVLDSKENLIGIVTLDDIREIMFNPEEYDEIKVQEIMNEPIGILSIKDPMESVAKLFTETGAWNLPVVDENNKYVGFVSKSKLFSSYRRRLIQFSEE